MTILEAYSILKSTKPARCERERYRQRDEIQHRVIPLCLLMIEISLSGQ